MNLPEFKHFTVSCARASGVSEREIRSMQKEGNESMWTSMFKEFDADNDGKISWEEAWDFLKENKP